MSAMFEVKVSRKKDACVWFSITIIHPDQQFFYNTKSFALLLILDPLFSSETSNPSLSAVIPPDKISNFDLSFLRSKAGTVVKKIDILETKNFPVNTVLPAGSSDKALKKFWSQKKDLPNAEIKVCVHNEGWIDHLNINDTWESGAFNIS